jgi:hypothetical protein
VQRVRTRRHEPLRDAVTRVDLLLPLPAAARRRQRHRLVVVATSAPAAATEVHGAERGERWRAGAVRGAEDAHADDERVGGGRRLRRRRRQCGDGKGEQERQEEEAETPTPRRPHAAATRVPGRWGDCFFLLWFLEGKGREEQSRVLGVYCSVSWMEEEERRRGELRGT